jgi:CheY-like chemotaxis protein
VNSIIVIHQDITLQSISCPTFPIASSNIMQNIKILLTDDDEDDLLFFRHALNDSGIAADLTAVSDGSKLIDYMLNLSEAPAPDIIFLDINMPGLDGKSCLREIRKQERFSDIPIVILSTSNHPKDIADTYRDGANKYITKTLFYKNSVASMRKLFADDWRDRLVNPSPKTFGCIQ